MSDDQASLSSTVTVSSPGFYVPPRVEPAGLGVRLAVDAGYQLLVYGAELSEPLSRPPPVRVEMGAEMGSWMAFAGFAVHAFVLHQNTQVYAAPSPLGSIDI